MKLRNKRTGKIMKVILSEVNDRWLNDRVLTTLSGEKITLSKLNEEWEDYEEPKEVWYIDFQGIVRSASKEENDWFKENEIGNYFETKEEAEKAVEKLKAWKRLKDAGFEFGDWFDMCGEDDMGTIVFHYKADKWNNADLDILFGGEE